jgi:FkbM family methyltransferase
VNSLFLRKVRVALSPRNWLLQTRLDNGALVAGYNRSGWGGRGIYIFRDALEPELLSLKHFLKPGSVFIDIGANVGVFTVKAAKEVGESGIVIAVEPFMESACQLSRNVNLNGFRNCRVRNFCAGKVTGQVKFYKNQNTPNRFSLIGQSGADSLSILCVSLNDICAWEGITRLDYLKIDAEGAEDLILEGGAEVIGRFRPIIQVEVNKRDSNLPQGYSRFSVPRGINNLFIPSERTDAIETAKMLGWTHCT